MTGTATTWFHAHSRAPRMGNEEPGSRMKCATAPAAMGDLRLPTKAEQGKLGANPRSVQLR